MYFKVLTRPHVVIVRELMTFKGVFFLAEKAEML